MRTMKKMASLLSACLFLLCCSAAVVSQDLCSDASVRRKILLIESVKTQMNCCDHLVAVGGNFNVPLGYQLKTTESLRWKFNDKVIFYKKPGRFILGKTDDINDDGFLKLTNLKLDKAGLYTPEVFDQNGRRHTMNSTNLCVLDPVKKPTLNITCLASEVVFICSHDPQPDGTKQYDTIHYKWFQDDNMINNETKTSMRRKVAETKNLIVSCEVGNKVSSAKSDSLTHTCIEPVKKPEINGTCKDSEVIITCLSRQQPDDAQFKWLQDGKVIVNETKMSLTINSAEGKNKNFSCEVYNQASSEKSGSFSFSCVGSTFLGLPEELYGVSIWVFIGGGAGLLVLIIIIIILCCVECKKKRRNNDEAELEYRAGRSSSPEYCTH